MALINHTNDFSFLCAKKFLLVSYFNWHYTHLCTHAYAHVCKLTTCDNYSCCNERQLHKMQRFKEHLDKASHLTAFCAWEHSPHHPLVSVQLMRPGSYWLKHVLQQWVTIGRKLVVYHFCGGGTRGKKMSDVVIMVLLELQFTLHLRPIWLTGWPPVVLGSGWLAVKVRWVKTVFCFCVVVAAHEHCW